LVVPSPTYITREGPAQGEEPGVLVRFDVIGGVVRCTEFQLWTERPDQHVTRKAIEFLAGHLDHMRTLALAYSAGRRAEDGFAVGEPHDMVKAVTNLPRPRNHSLNDRSFIERVAETYNANRVGGAEAVADAFGVARSSAQRYIKAARDAGLVEDRRRNRTSVARP
jgi:hypothetical protein